jgi:molybdate transport system substrate-binding protein
MSSLPIGYRVPRILLRVSRPRVTLTVGVLLASMLTGGFQGLAQGMSGVTSKELRVDAAGDMKTALPVLAQAYEHATGIKLTVSYGASGKLANRIVDGEAVDLFLSADYLYAEQVVAANLADTGSPIPYARGMLVLWARKDSPLQPLHLEVLTDARVKTVAVANIEEAPYGRAALSAIEKMKMLDAVKPKLVVAEDGAQAGEFAESGKTQLAFLSQAMATSEHFKDLGTFVLVPTVYPEIRQCAVVLRGSERRAEAHAFLDWLRSPGIQQHLPKLGFRPVR